jgi:hypothetical protein
VGCVLQFECKRPQRYIRRGQNAYHCLIRQRSSATKRGLGVRQSDYGRRTYIQQFNLNLDNWIAVALIIYWCSIELLKIEHVGKY